MLQNFEPGEQSIGFWEFATIASMKALLLSEYSRLSVVDVPMPRPGAGEVLVKVEACGICGSDVHDPFAFPITL